MLFGGTISLKPGLWFVWFYLGNFFTKYPIHDQLISINKRHTGQTNKEFNFRHDWNSLISDDESLLFKHYSKDYFPKREAIVDYLKDYAEKLRLKIRYNTTVVDVHQTRNENGDGEDQVINVLTDDAGNQLRSR